MKKLIALALCLIMLLSTFAGCASENAETEEDLGAYIHMYLTEPVYNFDPALAFGNESALRVVSLMYDNLFILDENGEPKKSLVKKCDIDKDEYTITLTLRNDTYWSDGSPVSANDVFFTWERLLDSTKSFEAASLLYDVKNARAAKEGDASIEDVGIELFDESSFMIRLNEGTDIDEFLIKLSSYALVPLRSDVVRRTAKENDWAKSPTSIVTSGPFRLRTVSYDSEDAGIILERNAYYRRDFMKDKPDKAVTPFRLIIDYTMNGEEILAAYEEGKLFYVGDLPLDVRSKHTLEEWAEIGDVNDALSTHSYVVNNNAVVRYYNASEFKNLSAYTEGLVAGQDGDQIFANAAVRKALSLAINRDEIAKTIVFAEAADGLIPGGIYETDSKKDMFADNRQNGIATSADMGAAKAALQSAGIDAGKYMFAISVPAYDEVHMKVAEMVQAAWTELGFHVAISAIKNVENKDTAVSTGAVITGVKDDIFAENYAAGKYEIAAIDYTAFSPSPFSLLAPIAKGYTGNASIAYQGSEFTVANHISGYNSSRYNELIESAFETKDLDARAAILHEAEGLLLEELPIIPVVFNKSLTMKSKELSNVDYSYYHCPIFTKTKLKNYEDYIPSEDAE